MLTWWSLYNLKIEYIQQYITPSGWTYTGKVKEDLKHGLGTFWWRDKSKLLWFWNEGLPLSGYYFDQKGVIGKVKFDQNNIAFENPAHEEEFIFWFTKIYNLCEPLKRVESGPDEDREIVHNNVEESKQSNLSSDANSSEVYNQYQCRFITNNFLKL